MIRSVFQPLLPSVPRFHRRIIICFLTALASMVGAAELVFDDVKVALTRSQVLLDADIKYHLTPALREALDHGVPLTFELHVQLRTVDAWIWDADVAEQRIRNVLRYHPLSSLYELRELSTGLSANYATRQAALRALGHVRGVAIVDRDQLDSGSEYDLRLEAYLDNDALPLPLRPKAYLSNDWSLQSETWERRIRP